MVLPVEPCPLPEKTERLNVAKKKKQDAALEKQVVEQTAQILRKRGGKRPGAGRKPNFLKRLGMAPVTAHEILSNFDLVKLWGSLLNSKNDDIRFRAVSYLTDREQGRPKNTSEFTGAISQYSHLSDADLDAQLEELKANLGLQDVAKPATIAAPTIIEPPALKPWPTDTPIMPSHEPSAPELECPRHGKYFRPVNAKSDMCPQCIEEADRAEKRLFSLLPGGVS